MSGATFLVERYIPGLQAVHVEALARRLASASAQVEADVRRPVRWLRSVALLEDETCLCTFSACSCDDVEEANRRANATYERIVPTTTVEHAEKEPR
jgi:hypothetical protein